MKYKSYYQTLYEGRSKIFIAQKSHCACRVLSLATIEANTILILFRTELGQAENFLSPLVLHRSSVHEHHSLAQAFWPRLLLALYEESY